MAELKWSYRILSLFRDGRTHLDMLRVFAAAVHRQIDVELEEQQPVDCLESALQASLFMLWPLFEHSQPLWVQRRRQQDSRRWRASRGRPTGCTLWADSRSPLVPLSRMRRGGAAEEEAIAFGLLLSTRSRMIRDLNALR